MHMYFHNFLVK